MLCPIHRGKDVLRFTIFFNGPQTPKLTLPIGETGSTLGTPVKEHRKEFEIFTGMNTRAECWGAGVVICLERGADLHMAQLMPLPLNVSCFSKIQIGFTFLVPAHLGSPGKRAVKWVCVCEYQGRQDKGSKHLQ